MNEKYPALEAADKIIERGIYTVDVLASTIRAAYADTLKKQEVTDNLLSAMQEVVDMIPPCPRHGAGCLSHASKWIARHIALELKHPSGLTGG